MSDFFCDLFACIADGIAIDTTNAVSIDAAAASNFTTTSGNLTLNATVGLLVLDGGSGINIGNDSGTTPINIGTSSNTKAINIGNQTSTSSVAIQTGTGNFTVDTSSGGAISLDATGASSNFTLATTGDAQDLTIALTGANNSSIVIDSTGTGTDAIRLNATGGIDVDSGGSINMTTSSTAADAIRFSTTGTGGMDIDLGSSGLDLDTTGPINLASSVGTGGAITLDAASNNGGVTISSGSQGIAINSGTGLIGIGHWSAGNIEIGTSSVARTIIIGNITGATQFRVEYGTGGRIYHNAGAPTSLSDASVTLTAAQILTELIHMNPSTDRTLTMPTAANLVSGVANAQVGDRIEFVIINESTGNNIITLAMGSGGTLVGSGTINPRSLQAHVDPGTGRFVARLTNVTASSEAYTIYRA